MARGVRRAVKPPRWTLPAGSAVKNREPGGAARMAASNWDTSFRWPTQFVDLVLHPQDSPDALEVDALVLGEPLNQPESGDVVRRIAPTALGRPARRDETHPVVRPQGLRMHPGQMGGDRDHEDRRVGVDPVRERGGCH